jgi:hypothetical protein
MNDIPPVLMWALWDKLAKILLWYLFITANRLLVACHFVQ